MSVKGTLRADQVTLGRMSIDWLKQHPQVTVLAACVNSKTGQTHAWMDGSGVQWSEKTAKALDALRDALEEDLAGAHMSGVSADAGETTKDKTGLKVSSGIAEHLGTNDTTPSV